MRTLLHLCSSLYGFCVKKQRRGDRFYIEHVLPSCKKERSRRGSNAIETDADGIRFHPA